MCAIMKVAPSAPLLFFDSGVGGISILAPARPALLNAQIVYDADSGQLLSGSLMDYGLPRADDLPMLAVHAAHLPTTNNILGVKLVLMDGTIVNLGGAHLDAPGYDLLGVVIGSEGQLGVVTEAKLPEGSTVTLTLILTEDGIESAHAEALTTRANVIWSGPTDSGETAAGVRFEGLGVSGARTLTHLLSALSTSSFPPSRPT